LIQGEFLSNRHSDGASGISRQRIKSLPVFGRPHAIRWWQKSDFANGFNAISIFALNAKNFSSVFQKSMLLLRASCSVRGAFGQSPLTLEWAAVDAPVSQASDVGRG
jgi:hypothetical protein